MKFIRDLDDDYHLSETEIHVGSVAERSAVMDSEGDIVFWIPGSLIMDASEAADRLYIDVANLVFLARDESFRKGERYGRERQREEFQSMLGIDKLVEALDNLRTIEAFVRSES